MELIYKLRSNLRKKVVPLHQGYTCMYFKVDLHGATKPTISLNNWSYYGHKKTIIKFVYIKADLWYE